MAVLERFQGRGIGGQLLVALLKHAASLDPGGIAWCLGRLSAEAFYIQHGFRQSGCFDIVGKGPRLLLQRPLLDQIRKQRPPDVGLRS
jgi:GNAT superfamily N-acetyltransferase